MENKRITTDELSQKLASARKIMKKVDNGDFERGAVNEKVLRSNPEDLIAENKMASTKPIGKVDHNKVNSSNLPEAIKRAMIENPIPQIGLDNTLDMNFVERTRKLMEADGSMPSSKKQPIYETTQPKSQQTEQPKTNKISVGELERRLTPIIENVIRKTLDEIVDRKLTQLLAAQVGSTINENLAIKVGDTIFTGKITKAKSSK